MSSMRRPNLFQSYELGKVMICLMQKAATAMTRIICCRLEMASSGVITKPVPARHIMDTTYPIHTRIKMGWFAWITLSMTCKARQNSWSVSKLLAIPGMTTIAKRETNASTTVVVDIERLKGIHGQCRQ
jgi:hypothetical protein